MAINWIHPFRGLQVVFSIVVLGLTAYVSSWWSSHWHQASTFEINFMIFTPAWSILALAPLLAIPLRFSHLLGTPVARYGLLALEGLTTIFWFGGSIALAMFLRNRICFGTVCDVARTSTAFGVLNSIAWAVTFLYGVIGIAKRGAMSYGKVVPMIKDVEMHQGV